MGARRRPPPVAFPADALEALERGGLRLLLDAQGGIVRIACCGLLERDADVDRGKRSSISLS